MKVIGSRSTRTLSDENVERKRYGRSRRRDRIQGRRLYVMITGSWRPWVCRHQWHQLSTSTIQCPIDLPTKLILKADAFLSNLQCIAGRRVI